MRPWDNYFAMVLLGLLLGLATGGFPAYAREISTAALVLAMTFSLTEIRFGGISPRREVRSFARALFLNYGALSGLILATSFLYGDEDIRHGWIVMAAVPSAVAVIPLTSVFKGDVRSSLVSSAILYVAALGLFPAITLAFAGRAADPGELFVQLLLQIALPIVASRALVRVPAITARRGVLVNVSFLVLVLALTGANRGALLADPVLVGSLAVAAFVRTWGIGLAVYVVAAKTSRDHAGRVADTLFASLKNLGLAALLAFSLFGPAAALPAIICLFFEIGFILGVGRWLAGKSLPSG